MELEIGGKAKHSDFYLRMLRGNYRKKAEVAKYEVTFLNEVSVKVIPLGSGRTIGTQFPRRYLIPLEEERVDQMVCRFCRESITKDSLGAVPDIDPVTKEHSGYLHAACQPDYVAPELV